MPAQYVSNLSDGTNTYTLLDEGALRTSDLVTSVSSSSTDSQYPSAKLFYDTVGDISALLPEETTINLLNNLDDSSFDGFAKVGSNLVGTNTYIGSDVFRHAAVPFTTPNYACKLKIEGSCTFGDTEMSFLPTFLISTAITPSNFETIFDNSGIDLDNFIEQWETVNDIFSLTQNPETDGYTIQEWFAYSAHRSSLTEAEWEEICDDTFDGEFYYIPGNSYARKAYWVAMGDMDVMGSYYSNCLNIMQTYDEQQPGLINYEQVLSPNTSYVLNFLSGFEASDTYPTNIEINKLEITKI